MKFLSFLIIITSFLFLVSFKDTKSLQKVNQPKTQGIITYTYQDDGLKEPFEKHLRFNNNGAWYAHEQKKETITEGNYNYYYYDEKQDWYYQNDSVYYLRDSEHYPFYFASWIAKEIEWEITEETQTIAGFLTRKAIAKGFYEKSPLSSASYKERGNAIAWFTTEIPLSYGPDGYEGLPGLIVKLQYENYNEIYITTLKSIEYKEVEDWQIPSTDKKIELDQNNAYNPWKLDKKWFKKKAKELGIE